MKKLLLLALCMLAALKAEKDDSLFINRCKRAAELFDLCMKEKNFTRFQVATHSNESDRVRKSSEYKESQTVASIKITSICEYLVIEQLKQEQLEEN